MGLNTFRVIVDCPGRIVSNSYTTVQPDMGPGQEDATRTLIEKSSPNEYVGCKVVSITDESKKPPPPKKPKTERQKAVTRFFKYFLSLFGVKD